MSVVHFKVLTVVATILVELKGRINIFTNKIMN